MKQQERSQSVGALLLVLGAVTVLLVIGISILNPFNPNGPLSIQPTEITTSSAEAPPHKLLSIHWTPVSVPPTVTRRPECVPYPTTYNETVFGKATPTEGLITNDSAVVIATQLPIAHTYNLSPNADPMEQERILVYRCNGTYDQYIVGLDIKIPEDLHLDEGDTIIEIFTVGLHSLPLPTSAIALNTPVFTSTQPVNTVQSTPQLTTIPYPEPYPTP